VLDAVRDVAANVFLTARLGELRERLLDRLLGGGDAGPDPLAEGEREALERTRREYYTPTARGAFGLDPDRDDGRDFEERGQQLMERAIWVAHRQLAELPCVGQPGFEDL
jgi:hypothetical protein